MQYRRIEFSRAASRVTSLAPIVFALACAGAPAVNGDAASASAPDSAGAQALDGAIVRDVARIRAATVSFKSLDAAVSAGYAANGGSCLDHPPHGAMGYHHRNDALLDDRIELERPEMLVYERLPDGAYRLNGVEYIIPLTAWPSDRPPPTVMGQKLTRAPSLGIWYRHVWVWQENPSGLFADWNPDVKC